MNKNNIGLVEYAKSMVGHPYWYGCYGQISTKKLYQAKKKQYPKMYEWSLPQSQLGVRVFDCVGLIKGYLWTENGKVTYKKTQDVSANGMYDRCTKKGKINSMPNVIGTLVFKDGHVGVYIGNGYVIEARGHAYGVVKTLLKDRGWTKWGFCPYMDYITPETPKKENKTDKKNNKSTVSYYPKYKGLSVSIVDALNSLGIDSSYKNRVKIAKKNGVKNYSGKASQNIKLLKLLKSGKLKRI